MNYQAEPARQLHGSEIMPDCICIWQYWSFQDDYGNLFKEISIFEKANGCRPHGIRGHRSVTEKFSGRFYPQKYIDADLTPIVVPCNFITSSKYLFGTQDVEPTGLIVPIARFR